MFIQNCQKPLLVLLTVQDINSDNFPPILDLSKQLYFLIVIGHVN